MTEGSDKLTKLRQRLFLVKLVLLLSFSAAAGTTILSVMMSFTTFTLAGYRPIAGHDSNPNNSTDNDNYDSLDHALLVNRGDDITNTWTAGSPSCS